jgi:hypothetical protein
MRNVRHNLLSLVALLAVAIALFTVVGAAQASAHDFTGTWSSTEGGTWYITNIGSAVYMYGEETGTNPNWATVGHGTIKGDYIKGTYATIPKGTATEHGVLNIKIISEDELEIRPTLVMHRM